MLSIRNLTAGYGGPAVIEKVDIEIREGEIVTIIGPNGAGKSTLLKSVFGLTKITEGEITFFNEHLTMRAASEISKYGICYVPQGRSVFPSLTVEENLEMGAYAEKKEKDVKANAAYVYQKFPQLTHKKHVTTRLLSGGEQQMVALGRALMTKPALLLLDEPSIGLAPKVVQEVFEKIQEIRKDGTSVLMVEQNAIIALSISDRGYVLELGKNKFHGRAEELLHDARISEAYLGKKGAGSGYSKVQEHRVRSSEEGRQ